MEKEKTKTDDRCSDVERNDDNDTSSDENSDSCNEIFSYDGSNFEAEHEEGRTLKVILPDGTIVHKRVYSMESAFEFKEKCLGVNYPQLQDLSVFMCVDDQDIEKTLQDKDTFADLLDDYQFIRIRYTESEDSTNEALNPVVKMKT